MRIGGSGELWLVLGPLSALVLVGTYVIGGPHEMIRVAERLTSELWNMLLIMFRR